MYYTLVVSLVSVPCCLPRAGDDPGNFLLCVGDYEFINEIKLPKKYVMYTVSQNTISVQLQQTNSQSSLVTVKSLDLSNVINYKLIKYDKL